MDGNFYEKLELCTNISNIKIKKSHYATLACIMNTLRKKKYDKPLKHII